MGRLYSKCASDADALMFYPWFQNNTSAIGGVGALQYLQ